MTSEPEPVTNGCLEENEQQPTPSEDELAIAASIESPTSVAVPTSLPVGSIINANGTTYSVISTDQLQVTTIFLLNYIFQSLISFDPPHHSLFTFYTLLFIQNLSTLFPHLRANAN